MTLARTALIDVSSYPADTQIPWFRSRVKCGKCGGKMRAQKPSDRKTTAYVCRDKSHLLRTGLPLDEFVTSIVVGRLSQPDAHLLLDDNRIDIPALQTERNALLGLLPAPSSESEKEVVEDMFWGMMSSREFLFNH